MKVSAFSFARLSPDLQRRLIALQEPASDRYVFLRPPSRYWWLAVLVAVGWLAYLFVSTQGYIWESWMFGLMCVFTALFIPLALFGLYRQLSFRRSAFKDGAIFTAHDVLMVSGDRVEHVALKAVEGFQFREDIRMIEIWIGAELRKIPVTDVDEGRRLEQDFNSLVTTTSGGELESEFAGAAPFERMGAIVPPLAVIAVGLVFAAGLVLGARYLNLAYDDDLTWQRVGNGKTVGDFDEYRRRHPNGSRRAEAERRIGEILSALKSDYQARLLPGHDPRAAAALGEVMAALPQLSDRNIYVRVNEKLALDDAVVRELRQSTGLQIAAYDYSVPPADAAFRREFVAKEVGVLFQRGLRSASVEFVPVNDAAPPGAASIEINYTASSVPNYYTFNWYSNGRLTTFFNPAASWEFDFLLRGADGRELYRERYLAVSSTLKPIGMFDGRDASNYSFDKVYFASVSRDLTRYLGERFGLSE